MSFNIADGSTPINTKWTIRKDVSLGCFPWVITDPNGTIRGTYEYWVNAVAGVWYDINAVRNGLSRVSVWNQ